MTSRWAIFTFFLVFFANISWAADADIENQLGAVEEAESKEDSGACGRLIRAKNAFKAWRHYYLEKLGTPEGVTFVACTYGITQGISNFLWAFDWVGHAGLNGDTSKIIQETAGISSAVECIVIGALVPAMLFSYQRKHGSPPAER